MTGAHLHLLLNHVPIIGTLIAVVVLAIGLLRGSADLTRVALLMLVVIAVITLPTVLTGEPAEEMVEHMPGVTRDVIHAHEEAAETAAMVMYATGVAALAALVLSWRGRTVRWLNAGVLLLGLVTFGLMARVGNLGGQVRHTEIRPGAPAPAGEPGERD